MNCPLVICFLFLILISYTQSEGQIYKDGETIPTTLAPSDGSFNYQRNWTASINFKDYNHPDTYECIMTNSYWSYTESCRFPPIPYVLVDKCQEPTPTPTKPADDDDNPTNSPNPTPTTPKPILDQGSACSSQN